MLNTSEILSTISMIKEQKLDIRTITMGISLLECAGEGAAEKIYDLVTRRAERLVAVGEDIEREFGIPIVNKRISVTPVSLVLGEKLGLEIRMQRNEIFDAMHRL